jgi:hypothetical protein
MIEIYFLFFRLPRSMCRLARARGESGFVWSLAAIGAWVGAEIVIGTCTVFLMVLIDSESAVLLALGYVGMLVAGIYASERVRRRLQAKPRLGAATVATAANEGEAAIN